MNPADSSCDGRSVTVTWWHLIATVNFWQWK